MKIINGKTYMIHPDILNIIIIIFGILFSIFYYTDLLLFQLISTCLLAFIMEVGIGYRYWSYNPAQLKIKGTTVFGILCYPFIVTIPFYLSMNLIFNEFWIIGISLSIIIVSFFCTPVDWIGHYFFASYREKPEYKGSFFSFDALTWWRSKRNIYLRYKGIDYYLDNNENIREYKTDQIVTDLDLYMGKYFNTLTGSSVGMTCGYGFIFGIFLYLFTLIIK